MCCISNTSMFENTTDLLYLIHFTNNSLSFEQLCSKPLGYGNNFYCNFWSHCKKVMLFCSAFVLFSVQISKDS